MKKIYLFFVMLVMVSCTEIPVEINASKDTGGGTDDLESQLQNVLIEEFTGVQCVNCPAGSEAIEQLLAIHNERLVPVTIHAGFWARKLSTSTQDLKNEASIAVLNLLAEPSGYPAAAINRKEFDVGDGLHLNKDDWAGIISSEKQNDPKVALKLSSTYDANSKGLEVTVEMLQKEALPGEIRLSLMIVESNIIDAQKTPDGIKDDYIHNHVLRDMMTAYTGDDITSTLSLNQVVSLNYRFTLDESWVYENIELVAIIHEFGERLDVLQCIRQKPSL